MYMTCKPGALLLGSSDRMGMSEGKPKGQHTRRDLSLRLVPAPSPLKSLHVGPGRRDLSHEQFTRSF